MNSGSRDSLTHRRRTQPRAPPHHLRSYVALQAAARPATRHSRRAETAAATCRPSRAWCPVPQLLPADRRARGAQFLSCFQVTLPGRGLQDDPRPQGKRLRSLRSPAVPSVAIPAVVHPTALESVGYDGSPFPGPPWYWRRVSHPNLLGKHLRYSTLVPLRSNRST